MLRAATIARAIVGIEMVDVGQNMVVLILICSTDLNVFGGISGYQ